MPDLPPVDEAGNHYLAKLFYQGVPPSDQCEEEHWYFFCFQDAVNWLEHSQGAVNQKKLETIGELASGVAHDFNNLIMGIQSNAEAMLAQPNMTPHAREGLVNIIRGCSTGASLTRSLLGYAKRQPLALSPFNLLDLVHDVSRIAGVANSKYRISLGKDLAERSKPIMVVGSYSSLSHCVLNLIKNAREAMPDGGTINVLWEGDNETAAITVADNGSGISEEDMARLFQPFFSTKKQGTGLGLAMVRGILQQHNGTVEVRSTLGIGTAVSLVWPRGEGAPLRAAHHGRRSPFHPAHRPQFHQDLHRFEAAVARESLSHLRHRRRRPRARGPLQSAGASRPSHRILWRSHPRAPGRACPRRSSLN